MYFRCVVLCIHMCSTVYNNMCSILCEFEQFPSDFVRNKDTAG